jgi:hypothetical protein
MSYLLEKDGVQQTVKERYLNKFLEQGWTKVSDTSPKKISKNVIKASADVIEPPTIVVEDIQSNPPQEIKGE